MKELEVLEVRSAEEIAKRINTLATTINVLEQDLREDLHSIEQYNSIEAYIKSLQDQTRSLRWALYLV